MMKETFNFNYQNRQGLGEILFGKGIFISCIFIALTLIIITGFILMPWDTMRINVTFRGLILFCIFYCFYLYHKMIINISFDDNNLYIKTWKKEQIYPLKDIKQFKTTYYASWGIVLIYIKRKNKKKFYVLWTPSFDSDRYYLFLNMKNFIEKMERWGGKVG